MAQTTRSQIPDCTFASYKCTQATEKKSVDGTVCCPCAVKVANSVSHDRDPKTRKQQARPQEKRTDCNEMGAVIQ